LEPLVVFRGAGIAIVGLLTGVVYLITNRQSRLTLTVRQRTREISRVNEELAKELTERKRAEEEVQRLKEFNEGIVQGVAEALLLEDAAGIITFVNPALEALLGYTADELVGRHWQAIVPKDEVKQVKEKTSHRSGGVGEQYETHLLAADGTGIPVIVSAQPIFEGETFTGILSAFTDITDRKRAEEQIRRHLQRIGALREIDRAITSTLDLTIVLDIILQELEGVIPYHSAGIFLLSDGIARLRASRGFPGMERALQVAFPVEKDALTRTLLREKRPLILADAQANVRFLARGGTDYVRSSMGVPLIARDKAVGFLTIGHREPGVYDAIAIENARLYEEAQRELAERKRAEEELRQSYQKLQKALEGTIHTLASAIEMRDPYTAGHQRRVTQLACAIAKEMGLAEKQIEGLRMAGLIHDIGKITIPAEILSKPGQLNDLEWGVIKAHPKVGYDILKTVEFPWPVAETVLEHHERIDGSGYPQGLSGKDILMKARILAVADVVEAMASHRPYRPARGIDKALEEISQNRDILYDPEVVDICLELLIKKGFEFE
jgi:PAS domain S-box-containing protein/putative nucleotidyltransferase with HDIG domain